MVNGEPLVKRIAVICTNGVFSYTIAARFPK